MIKFVPRLWIPLGIVLWIAVHESGVHATIAGVTVGLLLPVAMGERVEHRLHPWSAFVVVPLFALANAGIALGGGVLGRRALEHADAGRSSRAWCAGKLIGVSGATLAALRAGGTLPEGMPRAQLVRRGRGGGHRLHRLAVHRRPRLRGIPALVEQAKVGIFAGSLLSGLLGWAVLSRARRV